MDKTLLQSNNKIYSFVDGKLSDNLVPKMTSDTTPSGVAKASSVYGSGVFAYKAFDRQDGHWISSVSVGGKATISYQFTSPQVVSAYSLMYYASYNNHNAKDWTFEGSDDGQNWTVLDSRIGVTGWLSDVKKVFTFKNNKAFLHYRLNVAASSTGTGVALGEMEMFEVDKCLLNIPNYTEDDFLNYGIEDDIYLSNKINQIKTIERDTSSLGSGKIFEHEIDLSKRRVDKIILN